MPETKNPKVTGKFYTGTRTVSKAFVVSGKAIFTVLSKHNKFTYKIEKRPQGGYFSVYLNHGADVLRAYTYIGTLDLKANSNGYVKVSASSGFASSDDSIVMFDWAMNIIMKDGCTPTDYNILQSGRCGVCGRTLTNLDSIEKGIGATCMTKYEANKKYLQ